MCTRKELSVAVDDSARLQLALAPYIALLERFLAGDIADSDFEDVYNALYMNDETAWSDQLFDLLDGVFAVADAYVDDPELRVHVVRAVGPEELRAVSY